MNGRLSPTTNPTVAPAVPARVEGSRRGGLPRAWLLCLIWLWFLPPVLACRYNVRDLGFIDVQSEGYTLHCVVADAFGEGERKVWRDALEPVLAGANLRWDFVAANEVALHADAAHLQPTLTTRLPAMVLVSPDGFATNLFAGRQGAVSPPEAASALEAWVTSPIRRQLAEATGRAFGVILLFEGTEDAANAAATAEIEGAIEEISRGMAALPKQILAPPELIRLRPVDIPGEGALFWSMGLEAKATEKPRAAIFYGRARWIGPLIEMEYLIAPNLTRLFGIVGEDCECGMDLAWTRGTVLPLRWTESLHATAAKSLGFDPDSPMVRAEALRILSRYSRSLELARAGAEATDPVVRDGSGLAESSGAPDPGHVPAPPTVTNPPPRIDGTTVRTNPPARRSHGPDPGRVLLIMAMIGMIIVFGTLLVLMTAMHRWRESARPRKPDHPPRKRDS